jgi:hypothetical protein
MALLGVALDIMRRCRTGVGMLVVFGALLTASVAAHASGTITVDGSGAVGWLALSVVEGCSTWNTFVGGGVKAGF